MRNDSTSPAEKSRIQDGLRSLLLLVKLLEDEGIRIVSAEAAINRESNILFSSGFDRFRDWAENRGLKVECEYRPDCDSFLTWTIRTEYHGVVIHSYMTDMEKEIYDAEAEA